MKVALDTSVLVAAIVADHPNHQRAIWWFRPSRNRALIGSWHAIAEAWAVFTAMPLDPPVSLQLARAVIDRLCRTIRLVPPRGIIYSKAMDRCAAVGLRSGAVYEAIHLVTAEVEAADVLLTFNERDFQRLRPVGRLRIAAPPDPPGPLPRGTSKGRRS